MTVSRDEVLGRVRANKPHVDRQLPEVPLFDAPQPASLLLAFKENLERMGGAFVAVEAGVAPLALLQATVASAKVICSNAPEFIGNRRLSDVKEPRELADVDVAIVRASFAVAETGSVLLSEENIGINALAYLAQHLVVLLNPADIIPNLHHAYRRPEFTERRYACFHTGPSATADIEGVLIHGAQGVRSLSVLPIARDLGSQLELS
jgi:L-lactate dehydrogenase complex protein LldG